MLTTLFVTTNVIKHYSMATITWFQLILAEPSMKKSLEDAKPTMIVLTQFMVVSQIESALQVYVTNNVTQQLNAILVMVKVVLISVDR